ncbi:DUF362 domain-containing protein [Georgenia sp. H159]|uniref:DUF362 domain-containing protein n=1 Tax=Georgenia sp. H159 TaxID=3076115 RepID=UPI002D76902A|nr:4Fe-4S dicluster domain-containing protein [Georgenia sp. H159]
MADTTRPLLRWLAAHDTPDRVVLLCDDAVVPTVARRSLVLRLDACVKDTGLGLPAQLLAAGVDVVEVVPCRTHPEETAAQVASWCSVLTDGVVPFSPPTRRRASHPEVLTLGRIPLPRRVVLGLGARDSSPLDLELDDAARTLAAVRLLTDSGRVSARPATPVSPAGGAVPAGPAAALSVSGCTACGVCVRACPHDALVLEHDGATSTLTHQREACRSELECLRLCPVDAFSTAGPLPLADLLDSPVVTLAEVVTATCERCGAPHPASDGSLCPTCRFRQGNVFGSALPPSAIARLAAARREDDPAP